MSPGPRPVPGLALSALLTPPPAAPSSPVSAAVFSSFPAGARPGPTLALPCVRGAFTGAGSLNPGRPFEDGEDVGVRTVG